MVHDRFKDMEGKMIQLSTQVNLGLESLVGRLREQLKYLETGVPVMSDSLTQVVVKVQTLEANAIQFQHSSLKVQQACQGT